jgi:hypothetical protein
MGPVETGRNDQVQAILEEDLAAIEAATERALTALDELGTTDLEAMVLLGRVQEKAA